MRTTSIADLIGARIIGTDGSRHGTVVDVVVSKDGSFRLLELVIGRGGWIERMNMASILHPHDSRHHPHRIAWSSIDHIEEGRVYLEPDAP
jgi:sporulation protein YlmC with PRC-barrel domain